MNNNRNNLKLKNYYKNFFPSDLLFKLFNISINRELCFRLDNTIYKRYLNFNTDDEFKKLLIELTPTQIDLGPIYGYPATKENIRNDKTTFKDIRKELVFDIDVTDYVNRNCGCTVNKNIDISENISNLSNKKICNVCFNLVKAGMEHLNHILRYNFGFKKLLFIFSGGKGMHCWVLDEDSINITEEVKKSITSFIKIYRDNTINKIYKNKYNLDINRDFIQIDNDVTVRNQHLLKMPFSVHSSGRISVAVDINELKEMKLEDFPKLEDIIENDNFSKLTDINENLKVMEKYTKILEKLL